MHYVKIGIKHVDFELVLLIPNVNFKIVECLFYAFSLYSHLNSLHFLFNSFHSSKYKVKLRQGGIIIGKGIGESSFVLVRVRGNKTVAKSFFLNFVLCFLQVKL